MSWGHGIWLIWDHCRCSWTCQGLTHLLYLANPASVPVALNHVHMALPNSVLGGGWQQVFPS